jgi:hypothetical protein
MLKIKLPLFFLIIFAPIFLGISGLNAGKNKRRLKKLQSTQAVEQVATQIQDLFSGADPGRFPSKDFTFEEIPDGKLLCAIRISAVDGELPEDLGSSFLKDAEAGVNSLIGDTGYKVSKSTFCKSSQSVPFSVSSVEIPPLQSEPGEYLQIALEISPDTSKVEACTFGLEQSKEMSVPQAPHTSIPVCSYDRDIGFQRDMQDKVKHGSIDQRKQYDQQSFEEVAERLKRDEYLSSLTPKQLDEYRKGQLRKDFGYLNEKYSQGEISKHESDREYLEGLKKIIHNFGDLTDAENKLRSELRSVKRYGRFSSFRKYKWRHCRHDKYAVCEWIDDRLTRIKEVERRDIEVQETAKKEALIKVRDVLKQEFPRVIGELSKEVEAPKVSREKISQRVKPPSEELLQKSERYDESARKQESEFSKKKARGDAKKGRKDLADVVDIGAYEKEFGEELGRLSKGKSKEEADTDFGPGDKELEAVEMDDGGVRDSHCEDVRKFPSGELDEGAEKAIRKAERKEAFKQTTSEILHRASVDVGVEAVKSSVRGLTSLVLGRLRKDSGRSPGVARQRVLSQRYGGGGVSHGGGNPYGCHASRARAVIRTTTLRQGHTSETLQDILSDASDFLSSPDPCIQNAAEIIFQTAGFSVQQQKVGCIQEASVLEDFCSSLLDYCKEIGGGTLRGGRSSVVGAASLARSSLGLADWVASRGPCGKLEDMARCASALVALAPKVVDALDRFDEWCDFENPDCGFNRDIERVRDYIHKTPGPQLAGDVAEGLSRIITLYGIDRVAFSAVGKILSPLKTLMSADPQLASTMARGIKDGQKARKLFGPSRSLTSAQKAYMKKSVGIYGELKNPPFSLASAQPRLGRKAIGEITRLERETLLRTSRSAPRGSRGLSEIAPYNFTSKVKFTHAEFEKFAKDYLGSGAKQFKDRLGDAAGLTKEIVTPEGVYKRSVRWPKVKRGRYLDGDLVGNIEEFLTPKGLGEKSKLIKNCHVRIIDK